jgi:hypothetical protein
MSNSHYVIAYQWEHTHERIVQLKPSSDATELMGEKCNGLESWSLMDIPLEQSNVLLDKVRITYSMNQKRDMVILTV